MVWVLLSHFSMVLKVVFYFLFQLPPPPPPPLEELRLLRGKLSIAHSSSLRSLRKLFFHWGHLNCSMGIRSIPTIYINSIFFNGSLHLQNLDAPRCTHFFIDFTPSWITQPITVEKCARSASEAPNAVQNCQCTKMLSDWTHKRTEKNQLDLQETHVQLGMVLSLFPIGWPNLLLDCLICYDCTIFHCNA